MANGIQFKPDINTKKHPFEKAQRRNVKILVKDNGIPPTLSLELKESNGSENDNGTYTTKVLETIPLTMVPKESNLGITIMLHETEDEFHVEIGEGTIEKKDDGFYATVPKPGPIGTIDLRDIRAIKSLDLSEYTLPIHAQLVKTPKSYVLIVNYQADLLAT